MPRKKEYKIMIKNLKVNAGCVDDFEFLINILSEAAALERANKHLQPSEELLKIRDDILKQLGEQI